MKTTKHLLAITLVIFGMSANGANAASADYFLQISDIPGESVDNKHQNWIDIDSFSWSVSNSTPVGATGGASAGKPLFSPFTWTQQLDKSTPLIMMGVVTGKHYKNATLDVVRIGSKFEDVFFKMSFDDVVMSKLDLAGAGDTPSVAGALGYSKVTMTYRAQKRDGSLDTPVVGGWDLSAAKPAFFGSPLALQGLALAMPAPSAVPVPAAVWLLGSGLLGLVGVARRSTTPIAA